MKTKVLLAVLLCSIETLSAQPLTVEKIMRDPIWMGTQPTNITWGTDSKTVYFNWNPGKNKTDSAYRYELGNGKPQQAGYIEKEMADEAIKGSYNNSRTQVVFSYKGDIYSRDIQTGRTVQITRTEASESNPTFIKKDQSICFEKDDNFFEYDLSSGRIVQLTNFVHTKNKAATKEETIPQEAWLKEQQLKTSRVLKERKEKADAKESFLKKINTQKEIKEIAIGDSSMMYLTCSPDGKFIVYTLFKTDKPSKNTIIPNYVTESGYTTDIDGRTNVGDNEGKYRSYLFNIEKDTSYAIDLTSLPGIKDVPAFKKDYPDKLAKDSPVAREVYHFTPLWNKAGDYAMLDIRAFDYKDRWVIALKTDGSLVLIDRQHDSAWIGGPGIEDDESEAKYGWLNDNQLYYQSEATGYSHLYTYDLSTNTKKQLTSGDYEIVDVTLGSSKKYFYVLTNEEHPGKQNWYRIKPDGTGKEKITTMTGGYEAKVSPDEKYIAYRYSYSNKPWELYVQENTPGSKPSQVTTLAMSDEFKSYNWRVPEVVQIKARDGQTIYARLYEPTASAKNGAAVVFVHGAGYLHNVHYWWSQYFREYMFNNLLTDKGYTVIDVDYRASEGYGRDWRTGIYRYMGGKDLDDNLDAIKWLVDNKGIDPARVGMYGGSYGGFITLMTLFTKPDIVKAGAALRPVTDWSHYNHGYTARILNEPFTDSIAYIRSSPIYFAEGLKNHLLICHGMIDVNVHFQDVVRLTQRLIELGKEDWQLAPYPLEDHGFVEPSSWADEYKRILKLFEQNLPK